MKKYRHIINILILTVLIILAFYLLFIDVFWTGSFLELRHYISFLFTIVTIVALFKNINFFTLLVGVTLLIGNFGGLSSLLDIRTWYSTFNIGSLHIPVYYGQPFYSLLLLIYLIFNKGFFIGIVTKEYWQNFSTRTDDLELVFTTIKADNQVEENKNSNDVK